MLPLIQREVVDRQGWIDEKEFLKGLLGDSTDQNDAKADGGKDYTLSESFWDDFYYDEETCRIYRRKITVRAATPREGRAAGRELAAAILAEAKSRKNG